MFFRARVDHPNQPYYEEAYTIKDSNAITVERGRVNKGQRLSLLGIQMRSKDFKVRVPRTPLIYENHDKNGKLIDVIVEWHTMGREYLERTQCDLDFCELSALQQRSYAHKLFKFRNPTTIESIMTELSLRQNTDHSVFSLNTHLNYLSLPKLEITKPQLN